MVCVWRQNLTRSWLVELESSSGKGLETPRATQLAKMAKRMKISKGLTGRLRKRRRHGGDNSGDEGEGYFHSTIESAALLMGLLSLRQ